MPGPVTVAVTRYVDPTQTEHMRAWVQDGAALAEQFDGFLGAGWVRPSEDSTQWHMLYRFADAASLEAWEASEQRADWLAQAREHIESTEVERRTGIEGWFDAPGPAAEPVQAPPRWKQMVSIFLVFFPLSLLSNWALSPSTGAWPLPLRVLVTVLLVTPVMTYVAMPFVTRALRPWLTRGL